MLHHTVVEHSIKNMRGQSLHPQHFSRLDVTTQRHEPFAALAKMKMHARRSQRIDPKKDHQLGHGDIGPCVVHAPCYDRTLQCGTIVASATRRLIPRST